MLALHCVQRFPARPADPDSSVFAELFPAPQPEPSQPDVPTGKTEQMHLNWNPRGFLSDLSQQKSVTRFPPDVWQAFFCRSFGVPILQMLVHAHNRTLCSCKMGIDPLGDHVPTCKQRLLLSCFIMLCFRFTTVTGPLHVYYMSRSYPIKKIPLTLLYVFYHHDLFFQFTTVLFFGLIHSN